MMVAAVVIFSVVVGQALVFIITALICGATLPRVDEFQSDDEFEFHNIWIWEVFTSRYRGPEWCVGFDTDPGFVNWFDNLVNFFVWNAHRRKEVRHD